MTSQPEDTSPPKTRMAVLYLRTASAHQADRDMAIVAQQHVCSWRAHELGATVAGEFVDFGSGLSIERPGLDGVARPTGRTASTERRGDGLCHCS